MSRSPGLVSLTRRRFATPRSAAIVIVILTLLASFLIAAAPRVLADVLHDEVAFQIDQVGTTQRDLTASVVGVPSTFGPSSDPAVTEGWSEGADELFGTLAERLVQIRRDANPAVQAVTSPGEFSIFTEPIQVFDRRYDSENPEMMYLFVQTIADPLLRDHLSLVGGDWPAPWSETFSGVNPDAVYEDADPTSLYIEMEVPIEIVLHHETARDMLWEIGEERFVRVGLIGHLRDTSIEFRFRLAGLIEAVDADAPRWLHAPSTALDAYIYDDGDNPPSVTGGAWVDPGSWAYIREMTRLVRVSDPTVFGSRQVRAELKAWYPLSAEATLAQEPAAVLAGLKELTGQSLSLGGQSDAGGVVRARFESEVTSVLEMSIRRGDATTMTLAVAAVGPVAVSVALIVLAAGLIIRRRRGDLLLLSARGTSLRRLRRLLLWEGLLLGVIPAVAATAAALALTSRDAGIVPTVLAVAIGFIPAIALALALRPRTLEGGRADLDAPVRGRWARLLEFLVILLSVLAVGLLLFRGVGRGTSGVDPLVIAAPLLATVALGLLAVRLHPLWLGIVLRRAQKGDKLVPLVGAARSLRDPAAGTTAVLAMLVAVAIAVFSSLILATVDKGAVAAAERFVGGDLSIAGPAFDMAAIDEIASIEGVSAVTGLYIAGREMVESGQNRIASTLYVTDTARLAEVQAGFIEGFPAGGITPGLETPQVLVSAEVAAATGLGLASNLLGGVTIVGELTTLPGNTAGAAFIVMDTADYTASTSRGFFPRKLVIDLAPDADVDAVTATIRERIGGSFTMQSLQSRTEAIQASPAVSALRTALLIALVLAVLLSVVAILLVAGVSRDSRSRVVALLRTVGMGRRSGRSIVSWEFVPLGISALVGGLALGVALPLLVLNSIDLRPFTGGTRQPSLTVDPTLTAALIAAVVIALIIAVIGGVLTARTTSLVTVLRTEEDR